MQKFSKNSHKFFDFKKFTKTLNVLLILIFYNFIHFSIIKHCLSELIYVMLKSLSNVCLIPFFCYSHKVMCVFYMCWWQFYTKRNTKNSEKKIKKATNRNNNPFLSVLSLLPSIDTKKMKNCFFLNYFR